MINRNILANVSLQHFGYKSLALSIVWKSGYLFHSQTLGKLNKCLSLIYVSFHTLLHCIDSIKKKVSVIAEVIYK